MLKKIKEQMWTKMPVYGRWLLYPTVIFMIIMLVWGAKVYNYFGW